MATVAVFAVFCILNPLQINSQVNTFSQEETVSEEEEKIEEPKRSQNLIKGLKGIDSLSASRVMLTSMIIPAYSQAYNRQYWKIPVIYAGGAALIYGGITSKSLYGKTGDAKYLTQSNLFYTGAGLLYLGSLIDGLSNYKTPRDEIVPIKATLFSTFLPGLGQAYNGEYWKIPLIYGGFSFFYYWFDLNNMQYNRFRTAYNMEYDYSQDASKPQSEFHGRLSIQSLKNYRDTYRRQRDYAILYLAIFYAVNIIDATVFAHLSNFDVSENLSFNLSPAVMQQNILFAQNPPTPALGLNLKITLK
ncbi:MAG: DUF5683 domain-containing protein [Prevotellaceae bacterium]|nr:DUF5683 domain-containing protein [Prevotellaceae bacterium]